MSVEERLSALGITLPSAPVPVANYVPYVQEGKLLFLSGQGPRREDGTYPEGIVGQDVDIPTAQGHARLTGINLLGALQDAIGGDWSRVRRIVKVLAMVRATPDFDGHPVVINGFSDLMVEVLGDRGRHARSAVGMGSLPNRMTVEIEMIVAID
ncbi:RidA family protein [Aureimonas frigidaquae]|uniref:Endoribonuclease L-PSP n=1 Tax=Aureimonas frigidaquae TaxID=424757 RepID=A0A0N7KY42_9HYPH|nr:RidA family protein [Aureimonas frigidaquae]BAT28673.1 endoribonuclease L-PSP [Aureimonas frigidaquae]